MPDRKARTVDTILLTVTWVSLVCFFCVCAGQGGGGRGGSHAERTGMVVIYLRGVNHGFWHNSHANVSHRILFSRKRNVFRNIFDLLGNGCLRCASFCVSWRDFSCGIPSLSRVTLGLGLAFARFIWTNQPISFRKFHVQKKKHLVSFDHQNVNLSLLAPSICQQLVRHCKEASHFGWM